MVMKLVTGVLKEEGRTGLVSIFSVFGYELKLETWK